MTTTTTMTTDTTTTTESDFIYDPGNLTLTQKFCKESKKPKKDAAVFATVVDGELRWTAYSCHAQLYNRNPRNSGDSQSYTGYLGDWASFNDSTQRYINKTPEAQKYLDFLLGPESPWRGLGVSRCTKIENWGLHIPNQVFKDAIDNNHEAYFYNFLIALRLEAEYPSIVKSWLVLCDHLSASDAYSIAPYVTITGKDIIGFSDHGWDGGHKALTTEYYNYNSPPKLYLSPTRLRDADYNTSGDGVTMSTSNKGWCNVGESPYVAFVKAVNTGSTIKTKFSSIRSNTIEGVVKAFNEILKDK